MVAIGDAALLYVSATAIVETGDRVLAQLQLEVEPLSVDRRVAVRNRVGDQRVDIDDVNDLVAATDGVVPRLFKWWRS